MKFSTARAMQVMHMERNALDTLHFIENEKGRCLMNHEIQSKFGFKPLKGLFGMSDTEEAQSAFKNEFEAKILDSVQGSYIDSLSLDSTHAFDDRIFAQKNEISGSLPTPSLKKGIFGKLCFLF